MRKRKRSWTAEEKERILLDIKRLGVVAGCRKHGIYPASYYEWLDRYEAKGLEGLRNKSFVNSEAELKKKDKEIRLLKEIIAEKEMTIKMQEELLKKKFGPQKRSGK